MADFVRIGIIMAGGSGERFWPLSRPGRPKQLLRLTHPDQTMLEESVGRIVPLFGEEQVYVATSSALREAVLASEVVAEGNVLSEPARRNTLGAQCWIAANLLARGLENASVAVLTADHFIGDGERFRSCVSDALDVAESHGGIVTLGMPPDRPETGYGYIEEGNQVVTAASGREARRSASFREKPSQSTAEEFLQAGNFLWNGGMFFFTLQGFLEELHKAQPEAYLSTLQMAEALKVDDVRTAVHHFESLPNISVDYAVMERAEKVFVVRADFPWDDVGAWDAMERTMPLTDEKNVIQGDAILIDTSSSIVINDLPNTVVGVLGIEGLVVVASEGAILVCPKSECQRVRLISQAISSR